MLLDVNAAQAAANRPLTIHLLDTAVTPTTVDQLKEILQQHRGSTEVRLQLRYSAPGRRPDLLSLGGICVEPTPALLAELKALVGASNVT
jgi:DNA polymerase-3 subunit alpha